MNQISDIIKKNEPKRPILKNFIQAFLVGGIICAIAQVIIIIFENFVDKEMASSISTTIMVLIGTILTAFGLYDKIGQFGGAGTIVPITGFSNSMTCSAMEYKSEGIVLGIFANMFKLAGSVIAVGVVSAFTVGTIIYLLELI